MAEPITGKGITVSRLNHFFGHGESRNQVLFENCIEIEPGQLVIMTGPSGSGKTTLLTLIGALRSVQEGSVELFGQELSGLPEEDLAALRCGIGFIFQMHNLFDSLTAAENVKMALQLTGAAAGEMQKRSVAILERLGLGHRLDYKPQSLSGGQRQRVAIARALVNRPKIVLADEPTAALDKEASADVVNLLKELTREEGSTIVMVTHDNRILEVADRIVNMVDGRIVSDVMVSEAMLICQFLHDVELFSHLTPTQLSEISEKMVRRRYRNGAEIVRQGDEGREFFLIAEGAVEVRVDGQPVATLKSGDFFGEAALIADAPRNATIVSTTDVMLYVLDKPNFQAALGTSESFKQQLLKVFFQRQR